jgi:hypothetical protein
MKPFPFISKTMLITGYYKGETISTAGINVQKKERERERKKKKKSKNFPLTGKG